MNEEKYITIKELAELKGVSTRAIRLSKDKYITREITVKGGKSFEILLSSIEPELQEKYYSKIIPTYEVKQLPTPTNFHKPDKAKVIAIPEIIANNVEANLVHEAAIGKIAGEQLTKLMTLGLNEKQAEEQIIKGFLR